VEKPRSLFDCAVTLECMQANGGHDALSEHCLPLMLLFLSCLMNVL